MTKEEREFIYSQTIGIAFQGNVESMRMELIEVAESNPVLRQKLRDAQDTVIVRLVIDLIVFWNDKTVDEMLFAESEDEAKTLLNRWKNSQSHDRSLVNLAADLLMRVYDERRGSLLQSAS